MSSLSSPCPICSRQILLDNIEPHVQICLENQQKKKRLSQQPFQFFQRLSAFSASTRSDEISELDKAFVKRLSKYFRGPVPEDDAKGFLVGQLTMMFSIESHHLGSCISDFASYIKDQLSDDLVLLTNVVNQIFEFKQNFTEKIICYYEKISRFNMRSFPLHFYTTAIDEALFPLIGEIILRTYHHQFKEKDTICTLNMQQFLTVSPLHLDVATKYWIPPPNLSSPMLAPNQGPVALNVNNISPGNVSSTSRAETQNFRNLDQIKQLQIVDYLSNPPFYHAINCLKKLSKTWIPSLKIKCFQDTIQLTCQSALAFSNSWFPDSQKSILADDLIEMLTYVIIKSNVKDIYSQRILCMDFLTKDEQLDLPGYLLCSFQTAIDYLSELTSETLSVNAARNVSNLDFNSLFPTPQPQPTLNQKGQHNLKNSYEFKLNDFLTSFQNDSPQQNHSQPNIVHQPYKDDLSRDDSDELNYDNHLADGEEKQTEPTKQFLEENERTIEDNNDLHQVNEKTQNQRDQEDITNFLQPTQESTEKPNYAEPPIEKNNEMDTQVTVVKNQVESISDSSGEVKDAANQPSVEAEEAISEQKYDSNSEN